MSQEEKDPAFEDFMKAVLTPADEPDSAKIADAMLFQSFGALELRLLALHARRPGKSIARIVLETQQELREPRPVFPQPTQFLLDELAKLAKNLPPLAQEPEEPKAKNGARANRKTEEAKAKLPFYMKNRRF